MTTKDIQSTIDHIRATTPSRTNRRRRRRDYITYDPGTGSDIITVIAATIGIAGLMTLAWIIIN